MITLSKLSFGAGFNAQKFALYYLMRLMPYPVVRTTVSNMSAGCLRRHDAGREQPKNTGIDEKWAEKLDSLRRQGYAMLAPLLDPRQVAEIRAYLADKPVVSGGEQLQVDESTRGIRRAGYPLPVVLSCPHILDTINHPEVLRLAQAHLGCRPTVSNVGIHWTFPESGGAADVQKFHRDTDDWKFFKLFIYLSDVDEDSGPHEFVSGSHLTSGRVRLTPYEDEDVAARYGRDKMLRFLGARGTTFIEDTWGIHKGGVPRHRPRLLLQIQYSIFPVKIYEYSPVATVHPYERYTNRLLLA